MLTGVLSPSAFHGDGDNEWRSRVGGQAYKRRIARRRERYEVEADRDDGPFFLFVFAFFAAPAGIILGIAAATGYLDTLQRF